MEALVAIAVLAVVGLIGYFAYIASKKGAAIGEKCALHTDCNGFSAVGESGNACCKGVCTPKVKDFAGFYYCPDEALKGTKAIFLGDLFEPVNVISKTNGLTCKQEFENKNGRGEATYDGIDGGGCWSCPSGYHRTWDSVKAPHACVSNTGNLITGPFKTAMYHRPGEPLDGLPKLQPGEFRDLTVAGIYACPYQYVRTGEKVTSDRACQSTKPCPQAYTGNTPTGSFEDGTTGKCYTCPEGYVRGTAAITGDNACVEKK